MVQLLLAEKPSLARTLSEALGFPLVGRDGSIPKGVSAAILPLVGHVVELEEPEAYGDQYKNWSFESLPILPEVFQLRPIETSLDVFRAAVKAMTDSRVKVLVNACDIGREGELIFALAVQCAAETQPAIRNRTLMRLWPTDLTDEKIHLAWKDLKPSSWKRGLRDAAFCRMEADWLLGMNATRAQTIAAQSVGGEGVFSIGRVQTPTLALIVDRDLAIKRFVPKAFWTLEAIFEVPGGTYPGRLIPKDGSSKDAIRFDEEGPAKALEARLRGKPGHVLGMSQKDEKEAPQQFYDLGALQQACNRRFGLTAEQTLKVAQSLYEEKKIMSYPRTNSRYLTTGVAAGLPEVLEQLAWWPQYAPLIEEIRQMGTTNRKLGKRWVDGSKVEDHWALVPLKLNPDDSKDVSKIAQIKAGTFLDGIEAKVFDLVVRRVLGAFFPDRVEGKTEILTGVDGEHFRTTGTVVKEEGWSRIDPKSGRKAAAKGKGKGKGESPASQDGAEGEDDGDQESLPAVQKGQEALTKDLQAKKGMTTPPRPYTEADLLEAMETAGKLVDEEDMKEAMKKNGLGTPATRAAIIETLVRRKFIERQKTQMRATEKGTGLIESIKVPSLKSPELTGEWEAKMARMEHGEYTRETFSEEIREYVKEVLESIRGSISQGSGGFGGVAPKLLGKCPKCQEGDLYVRSYKGKPYVQCSKTDNKKKIYCVSYDAKADGSPVKKCRFCGGGVKVAKSAKTGKTFEVCSVCDKFQKERFEPVEMGPCPKCGTGKLWHKAWEGRHYATCDQRDSCKFGYDVKQDGTPAKICKEPGCGGFVSTTPKGSKICSKCSTWQTPKLGSFGKAKPKTKSDLSFNPKK